MKKHLLFFMLLCSSASFVLAQETCTYPATTTASVRFRKIQHPFTVDANGTKVLFAPGNLQYQASTQTWRFAEHQYDYIGNAPGNSVTDTAVRKTQSVWIDLFVYGHTGHNGKEPTARYTKNVDGWGQNTDHMYGSASNCSRNYDWGYFCDIQYNGETISKGTYRVLKKDEWNYLQKTSKRTEDGYIYLDDNLSNEAISNKIQGRLLYPDDFPSTDVLPKSSKITLTKWIELEKKGVVFLPKTGYYGSGGAYGTSYYAYVASQPSYFWYNEGTFNVSSSIDLHGSVPVRLVKNY